VSDLEKPKRVRKLKVIEVKPRRRLWWTGPVIAVFVAFILSVNIPNKVKAQDDYNFGGETVNKGYSANPSYKNSEDSQYNQLMEADQYADTNYSGSTESMTYGTTGGGAFPSALNTDDGTRRNYIEANLASSPYTVFLDPTSDYRKQWGGTFPSSPTTHWDKLDDAGTADTGDTTTTYISATAIGQSDVFQMSDMTDPGAGATMTVTEYMVNNRASASTCNILAGLRIGTTQYQGITRSPTSSWVNTSSSVWSTNPAGGAWTYTAINALQTYLNTTDATPNPYVTKLVLKVSVTYTANYQMQGTIAYNNVVTSGQTIGYSVVCQGYRSGTENFYAQAWNYTSSAWVTKTTIQAASDTNYNFTLLGWAANCERSSGNVVQIRLIDVTGSDTTQDTLYLDLLKIRRVEIGYALDIVDTCTIVAQYGNITLRIKAYTSPSSPLEGFKVNVWNYTSLAYDLNKLNITSTTNTWQTTIDLCDSHHRSGTTVQVQFVDATPATSDIVQHSLFLDVLWVTRYHTNPVPSKYGRLPADPNLGDTIHWFLNYSDYDNEAPSAGYPKVHIDSTDYSMTANNSYVQYTLGKSYYLDKADLSGGSHTYYFIIKDANSPEITTSSTAFKVNRNPTLTVDGVTPTFGVSGDLFSYYATYTDADGDPPSYMKVNIDSTDYDMTANGTGSYLTGKPYHYDLVMTGGNHLYYFKTKDANGTVITTTPKDLFVDNPPNPHDFGRAPADPLYITMEVNFTCIYTDADNDPPNTINWREDGGVTQNLTMVPVDPSDIDWTNGVQYYVLIYLSHGQHNYDFYAEDIWGVSSSGGENTTTIQNRDPVITSKPSTPVNQYRNQFWYYLFEATDPDTDTVSWAEAGPSWLSINSGTGNLSGTTCNTPGNYDIIVWANDSFSGSGFYFFTMNIVDQNPEITNGPGAWVEAYTNTLWYYDFDATDPDTGDSISWEASGPVWLTINSANGNLSGTTTSVEGTYDFTVWANDSYGGSDSYVFQLNLTIPSNLPPYFTTTFTESAYNHTNYQHTAAGVDPESQPLTFGLFGNCTTWLSIGPANGTLWGYPTVIGWSYYNLSLSDGLNTVWQNGTLTVSEYVPPIPPSAPTNYQLSMGVVLMIGLIAGAMLIVWRES